MKDAVKLLEGNEANLLLQGEDIPLKKRLASVFCKGSERKYLGHRRPHSLSQLLNMVAMA